MTISVLMCVYNVEKYIRNCIESLLDQTIKDFEIVILDDGSTDNTRKTIEDFDDKRIRYYRSKENLGIAKSRNKCIKLSKGENVFFTDGDCTVSKDWIEQGLEFLKKEGCVGVEGRTYYVSEEYKPTYSDGYVRENKKGGQFMTSNIAYKKSVIEYIGGFDERYTSLEDRDLALRAKKHGRILFNPEMVVYHPKITLKPMQFAQTGREIRNRVLLYKKLGEGPTFRPRARAWRIVHPSDLAVIVFPALMFASFFRKSFRNRFRTMEDFVLFPFNYLRIIYERLNLWAICARERVFFL